MRYFFFIVMIIMLAVTPSSAESRSWKEHKGDHFIIYYYPGMDEGWVSEVLRAAEGYYNKVADQIGYTRYGDFWTWEERAKVYIYPDKNTFMTQTGFPEWSTGVAGRDSQLSHTRIIASYVQEEDFLDGVLPHEIAHLILHDFLPQEATPLWFDEGMAQLQEKKKLMTTRKVMPLLIKEKLHIPLEDLDFYNVRLETDTKRVAAFYLESISILDFLIDKYGNFKFRDLCQHMKSEKNFKEALKQVYTPQITSLEELEKKWLNYMKTP